jgi:hypothetical protein
LSGLTGSDVVGTAVDDADDSEEQDDAVEDLPAGAAVLLYGSR